jgi:hypothetical protein
VDAEEEEEEEEEDGDEDERHVHEGLRRLRCGNSEEADIRAQGNSSAGGGGYRHQSDQGDVRPERLTRDSGMDVDRGGVGGVDGAGVAPQVEPSGSAGRGNKNSGAMDVDADEVGLAARGEQSGAAGVGSMNGRDKAPSEATPESRPGKTPSPSNGKSSPVAGEKRKNPTRKTKGKQTDELPPPPPRPKPKPKPEPKIHPQAQPVNDVVERSYFEEIKFGGTRRLVDIIDLTQDMVSRLPS